MKRKQIFTLVILFIVSNVFLNAQSRKYAFRLEAQKKMLVGRYGEAIDLLNKYISAFPQKADGYNLRGLSFEKRKVYEYAVYDFKSARKLEPNNRQIRNNLARATAAWQALLYNNIEGYKREIAIDPSVAVNYLKIGKSFKNLGKWGLAEEWYDKYLTLEEASADEIIRYSEILAKNGHIKKGEPILKRYTEKYPKDQRLWSRYGYFVFWLGKNKTAIDAFENALAIRPYFKEALDGLDRAKGKPYIYSINDTSIKYRNGRPIIKKRKKFEYFIDRYYRLVRRNPKNNGLRLKLINGLVKVDRYVEAEKQLELLATNGYDQNSIDELTNQISAKKDSVSEIRIAQYTKVFKKDPKNKKIAIRLSEFYANISDYDSAIEVLESYVNNVPGDNPEVNFRIAKYSAWNMDFDRADEVIKKILVSHPNNLDYQLLQGQILVWSVRDLDGAKGYLENVLRAEPNNIYANVAMVSLNSWQKNFDDARRYLMVAKSISPKSNMVISAEGFLERAISAEEGMKIYRIRAEAGTLAQEKDFTGAVEKYNEYLQKITAPNREELLEYADILFAAKQYDNAVATYNQVLEDGEDFDVSLLKARAQLWTSDSLAALNEFKLLAAKNPNSYDANLYLAEAYTRMEDYNEASNVYENMLDTKDDPNSVALDSTQIKMINSRLGWISNAGGNGSFGNFPTNITLVPTSSYFVDNQDFSFNNVGFGVQIGLTNFLSAGVNYNRTHLESSFLSRNLTAFEGKLYFNFSKNVSGSFGFGQLDNTFGGKRNISDGQLSIREPEEYSITASYQNTDGRLVLYSPTLIPFNNFDVDAFRLDGYYKLKNGAKFSAYYNYFSVSDGNTGNSLLLKIGKEYYKNITLGYEFGFSDYGFETPFYYSPQNYSSHSLWMEYYAKNTKHIKLKLGGKLGYAPSVDFLLRELYGELIYQPVSYFSLNGRIGGTSSYRSGGSYSSFSAVLSAYWSFY